MISKKVFIDSSLFVAFIDRANQNHPKAVKSMEDLAQGQYLAYTSLQNIHDAYATLTSVVGVTVALDFLQAILESDIEILFPQKADLITSHRMLRVNKERQITLREILNATLMQKKGIVYILTLSFWHNLFGTYVSNLSAP